MKQKQKYVNKDVIVDRIHHKYHFTSKEDTKKVVYAMVKVMHDALKNHEDIMFHELGHFKVSQRKPRNNVDPLTKQKRVVPARMIVKFKVSKILKQLMNAALTTQIAPATTNTTEVTKVEDAKKNV